MPNINDIFGQLDENMVKQIQAFAASEKGKALVNQLKNTDKGKLMEQLGPVSEQDKQKVINQLSQNPEMIQRLKKILGE